MISIHALLAESDEPEWSQEEGAWKFQSTLSLRRATIVAILNHRWAVFQSTLSLRRATATSSEGTSPWTKFQSTLSLRRATGWPHRTVRARGISIHALLAESDQGYGDVSIHVPHFNPRSPCGERPCPYALPCPGQRISIHALLAESDFSFIFPLAARGDFNPRSPCGERQQIPPNWPYRFCLKCQFKDGEKSKKAKGSASAQASSPAYEKNKVRIPWGDFECFRFAPIK